MKKLFFTAGILLASVGAFAQPLSQRLQTAYQRFEGDSQLSSALSSLYVINAATGEVIFDKNSRVGLATASTLKVVTAATAYEVLGRDFRYETVFLSNGLNLKVISFGDPTLGSWRYHSTKDSVFYDEVIKGLKAAGVSRFSRLSVYQKSSNGTVPSGWIYEDMGNYYGAGASDFIWHENQYDLTFIPGAKQGDDTEIDTSTLPVQYRKCIFNECKTGAAGSGDNAYVYPLFNGSFLVVKGTVPAGVKKFTISGADFSPAISFSNRFLRYAADRKVFNGDPDVWETFEDNPYVDRSGMSPYFQPVYSHFSPALDSIVYWFLKKSINLYGEALIKTIAFSQDSSLMSTEKGVRAVIDFWKSKGLSPTELNIVDGSGLSPLNRVTTHAQVTVLKYARSRPWFDGYYDAFPEYNGMKMKSGTINDVKGFCGYQKSKDGNEYIFSFLVNNYNGASSRLIQKMYKVLDELK